MSTALLVAEPEPTLVRHLTSDGFRLVEDDSKPDLVLLGASAALDEYRRRLGNVPVIVLGDPDSDSVDCVRALERGCDDFVPRPFAYEELLARIRAVLRRTSPDRDVKLMSDPERVFTKEELLRDVWGFRSLGRTRTLDSHASRLRRKLQDAADGRYVHNVWGVGYRLLD
jgi:DNA-binding response OmpR family regulator